MIETTAFPNEVDEQTEISPAEASRRQQAIALAGRQASKSADHRSLMQNAAGLLAETLGAGYCGVAETRTDSTKLRFWMAKTSSLDEPGAAVVAEVASNEAGSLAGFAIGNGGPVASPDLAEETRFVDPFLRRHGITSCLACPLQVDEQCFGVLTVLSRDLINYGRDDLLFVDSISQLVAGTLARYALQQQLSEEKHYRTTLLETADTLVVELAADARIVTFNRACREAIGFAPDELENRTIWSALLAPEEVEPVKSSFDQLKSSHVPVQFECFLLTKLGERRRVSWSFAAMRETDGKLKRLIGAGIDITDRVEAENEIEHLRQSAEKSQAALARFHSLLGQPIGSEDGNRLTQPFERLPEDVGRDRRQRPRRSYPYIQLIAPLSNGKVPEPNSFREVRCRDISAGGFCFHARVEPSEQQFVVAFGIAPSLMYLLAEVVHVTQEECDDEACYLVGCRYTGRIEYK